MKVELAQAVAQTAMNAIMAYGSVVRIPIVGPIMAPIAAAAAIAAGAIQIAAIKNNTRPKQRDTTSVASLAAVSTADRLASCTKGNLWPTTKP